MKGTDLLRLAAVVAAALVFAHECKRPSTVATPPQPQTKSDTVTVIIHDTVTITRPAPVSLSSAPSVRYLPVWAQLRDTVNASDSPPDSVAVVVPMTTAV